MGDGAAKSVQLSESVKLKPKTETEPSSFRLMTIRTGRHESYFDTQFDTKSTVHRRILQSNRYNE